MKGWRRVACATALVTMPWGAGLGDSALDWVETRQGSTEQLLETIAADLDVDGVVRARLTLADRALNQSIDYVANQLIAAEAVITPETDAAFFAAALRCQLEHRQGLPSAERSCATLAGGTAELDNALVQAYRHATRSYYFYREGQHGRSLKEAESALALSQTLGDQDLLAAANNLVGVHFATKLRPRVSIAHFETALEHARQMVAPEFRSLVQLNLASSYTYLGFAERSLELLREVSATPIVNLYPTRQLVVASMIAQAAVASGRIEGTEQELLATMESVKGSVLPDGMTFGYTGLGIVQLADLRPVEALTNFNRVLEITNRDFSTGMDHPRIQLIAVPYAVALRESGRIDESRALLESIIASVPENEPDQLLVFATTELATTLRAAGERRAAQAAAARASRLESMLWDDNFRYRIGRLNVSLEMDRQRIALELAQAREATLRARADREAALRWLSWLVAAIVIVSVALLFFWRTQSRIASTERAANERLEELVEQRTRELSEEMAQRLQVEVERRRLSEKLSEGEKMRVIGRLTAGVAHDFNNLMAVVALSAENLKRSILEGQYAQSSETIDDILSAADTGAKITDGLLAYVRKQPLRPEVIALDSFIENNVPIFRNILGSRIVFSTSLEPCFVTVDKGRLTTSLLNLVLNAKDAMPSGGELSLELGVSAGSATIVVRDTGVGMSEDARKQAFEPFFTTKDAGDGAGLGLSMAYGFAKQSGGNLSIASVPGEGTALTLSLPLSQSELEDEDAPAIAPQMASSGANVRALVVEDRDFLRRALERTLEPMGMQVQLASNADEALEIVTETGLPDLLVCDVTMPGSMDGPDLAAELRRRDQALPVLMISGYSEPVDTAYGFLAKPFTGAELESAIERELRA